MTRPDWELRETAPDLRARYLAEGHWTDDTLTTHVVRGLSANPTLDFRVWSHTRPAHFTFADCDRLARGLAAGLKARGIGEGDVVAFQMPNCFEASITFYGAAMLGVVLVPIVHFYGPKEVGHILRESGAKAFLSFDRFGSRDFVADYEKSSVGADALELVAFVGGHGPAGTIGFDDLILEGADFTPVMPDPDSPAVVGYTSGTTSDPKGVVHTHRTLNGEMIHMSRMGALGIRPTLVGAPVGHAIGMQGGLLAPVLRGMPVFLIDQWDPGMVLDIIEEFHCTSGSGSTYFLTSLLDHPKCTEAHIRSIEKVGMGGSAIPAAVADRAEALGIKLLRSYGSTEHPSTTGSTFDDPREQRNYTDGVPLGGVEVRLVDDDGHDVPDGEPGEIWSRGPDLFVGYTNAALTKIAVDPDGWYASGDIAIRDEHGAITITDRKKDIIIRGGENISAAEVEELLQKIPGISEVAVVAAPDARLGEHACAFVRLIPGSPAPSIDQVREHLTAAGLARQKFPEEIRVEDELPRTASGKIQKFVLRDRLRKEAAAG
ncbi:MAG: cyclohexanecarboxylate-CoA ligase [Actinobacteria bacterium]|nr:cyclohexanecarboxylate-CoA ligase [Actinomycetota bacterium]